MKAVVFGSVQMSACLDMDGASAISPVKMRQATIIELINNGVYGVSSLSLIRRSDIISLNLGRTRIWLTVS